MLAHSFSAVFRIAMLAALAAPVGCNDAKLSLEERVELASMLPGIRDSKHSELRAELRLIEESLTLPEQLNSEPVPAHKNAAVALAKLFDDQERLDQINARAAALLGTVGMGDQELVATDARGLADRWVQPIRQVTDLSKMEACNFGLRYPRGYFNDVRFLNQSAAACRLLLIDAVSQSETHPEAAIEKFALAWRWTDWLAAERHLESRLKAAELRGEALRIANLLANKPETPRQVLLRLQEQLAQSLAKDPSISEILQRERALALVTYEAIRLGLVDLLFTSDEREELRTAGVLTTLQQATPDQIDADEAAYLAYVRELLVTAEEPFHKRRTKLAESDRLLAATADGDSYPWFANRLFAENLTLAQAEIARDQSRLEAWVLTLAAASGSTAPAFKVNPLNGKLYTFLPAGREISVDLGDQRTANPRVALPR
ncbi:MAG: hypothetical protein ACR2NU_00240 [Aeoliella sp.]